jgi:hypothetical protein
MLKGVDMTTLRAIPCPLLRVGIPRVNHFHNQMTVQAHSRFTVDILLLDNLAHVTRPPFDFLFLQFDCRESQAAESTTMPQFR